MNSNIEEALSLLTLIGGVLVIVIILLLIIQYLLKFSHPFLEKINNLIINNVIIFLLIISLTATLGSLFYSEVMGYAPCVLCWYQRILMYPQALLLWMAFVIKDKAIVKYNFFLSLLGAPLALYHYLHQIGVAEYSPCTTVGYSVSCAERFFMSYGYITIPMMSFTAFMLLLLFSGIYLFRGKLGTK